MIVEQLPCHGQPIGVVVAETFECAVHAATLVTAEYEESKPVLDFEQAAADKFTPHEMDESDRGSEKSPHYERGEPEKALESAIMDIGKDLNSQYLLSYAPSAETSREPGFHNIRVTVNRPGLKIRILRV